MIRLVVCLLAATLLTACASGPPPIPKTVTVVVERYKPLPTWATKQVAKPMPATDMVGDRLTDENARGAVIDFCNCITGLLAKLDAGQPVKLDDCKLK
jgi:hypothetical protein